MSLSIGEIANRLPELWKSVQCLKKELKELSVVNSIDNLLVNGNNLDLLFTNESGQVTLSTSLLELQQLEIKDNVQNFNALSTIVAPDLYQFAYVRESQGIQWINYRGSGLYMWDGTNWVEDDTDIFNQLQSILNTLSSVQNELNNKQNSSRIGWWNITDTTFTSSAPQNISANTRTKLIINSDSIIESFGAENALASNIWDNINNKITPLNNGDSYLFRLSMTANPALNNRNFIVDLDIGGTQGIIFERNNTLARGANVDTKISMTNSIFTLGTFMSNGGEIYITCDGDVEVFDISLFIQKVT